MDSKIVQDIMTVGVIAVTPQTPLLHAAKIMSDHDFTGMPVIDADGKLIGILTEYDLIAKGSAVHLPTIQKLLQSIPIKGDGMRGEIEKITSLVVRDVMNPDPMFFQKSATIDEVVTLFRNHHRVNPVPVVDENKKVIGVVSRSDILRLFDNVPYQAPTEFVAEGAMKLLKNDYLFLSKIAEERISETLQHSKTFEDAVISSGDAIAITDANATILYVNPAWERLNGYSLDEARGKNPRILQSGKTSREVYKKMWETLLGGKPFVTEDIVNKRKDGSEYREEIMVSPIRRDGITVLYVGIIRDITRRKQIDAAKSEYISLTAHQLRTPLTLIGWNADALLGERAGKLNREQRACLEQIVEASRNMRELADTFLNAAKIEAGTFELLPEPVDVAELADNSIADVALALREKNIALMKDYSKNTFRVTTDQRMLRIIFQNLISNAVRYSDAGDTVTVRIAKFEKGIIIEVRDTGIGIPEAEQEKVFSKLFRARNVLARTPDGTGLGLYVVKMAVEKLGGSIRFESEENKGTAFFVSLPVS